MTKPPHAGGEIDSFCTKCRMVLNHRIIAMVGANAKRVECSTCGSHHNYRARAPGDVAPRGEGGTRRVASGSGGPRSTRGPTKAQQAILDLEKFWEKATSGKPVADFKRYSTAFVYDEGSLIHHSKFGDGVVTRVLDAKKVEILFRDGHKTLAQGMTD
ncbi:MAG: hypothetical protein ACRELY_30290 [Polyangiaceae bacterium]